MACDFDVPPDADDAAFGVDPNRCAKNSVEGSPHEGFFAPHAVSLEHRQRLIRSKTDAERMLLAESLQGRLRIGRDAEDGGVEFLEGRRKTVEVGGFQRTAGRVRTRIQIQYEVTPNEVLKRDVTAGFLRSAGRVRTGIVIQVEVRPSDVLMRDLTAVIAVKPEGGSRHAFCEDMI